jgi:putative ABC transport system ATP-binding protein
MLTVTDLCKSYRSSEGTVPVLRNVSLSVAPGETLALTGESGSGKSTLLHLIGGLDRPDSGEIILFGQEITGLGDAARARVRRERVGLVFQQFNLVPSLSVAKNIALQARLAGRSDPAWTAELIARLGLSGLEERYPEQLSGGQQQRVAIGRTLANRPGLILADEPTGNLDEETGDSVLSLMLDLAGSTGAALIMATHSGRLAQRFARRIHLRRGALEPA